MLNKADLYHALYFGIFSVVFLFLLHLIPLNQLFIDPFSEAIKNHDLMDVAFSKFRNHKDPALFDENVFLLNSEVTNKSEIAEAISYLKNKEIGAIGVDLIFENEKTSADTLLAEALNSNKVVLGFTFNEIEPHTHLSILGLNSDSFFLKGSVEQGYVNLASDDGFSVRAFEPTHIVDNKKEYSFAVLLAKHLNGNVISKLESRDLQKEWINYRRFQPGEANMEYPINSKKLAHYPAMSISTFLKDKDNYGAEYFKDKVVLIGFFGENRNALSMKDRYFTPLNEKYNGRSLPDMHGVVIHANIISMLTKEDYIKEFTGWWLYAISFLFFFVNYLVFSLLARKKLFSMIPLVRVFQALEFIFLFGTFIILLAFFNIKIGFVLIITAVILSYEFFEFYSHKLRNRFAQHINKYFIKDTIVEEKSH